MIQLWSSPNLPESAQPPNSGSVSAHFVSFSLGENETAESGEIHDKWKELWRMKTSSPVAFIDFSPDGRLFASASKTDRLVKVWYSSRKIVFPSQANFYSEHEDPLEYAFVYLPHPRAVTSFSWRKTSRYMPKYVVSHLAFLRRVLARHEITCLAKIE